jgi:hypothetical protein
VGWKVLEGEEGREPLLLVSSRRHGTGSPLGGRIREGIGIGIIARHASSCGGMRK